MSTKALPLLFINLGGEMVYILHQRLRAQSIEQTKAQKVLNDIVGTMFNKRFMEELFKPQELHSKKAMRTVFDRLAHASIMRLNAASMDKLYDLMTMAIKYQVSLVSRPKDVLLVTLNHIDGIRDMISGQTECLNTINTLYKMLVEHYGHLSSGDFQLIRQSMLSFFQDMHVRVSIFLKEKQQNANGRFVIPSGGEVPFGSEVPGKITIYGRNGQVSQAKAFNTGASYRSSVKCGSTDMIGDRVTKLGQNMYFNTKPSETTTTLSMDSRKTNASVELSTPDPLAAAQLDLLSRLIGSSSAAPQSNFRLNLFNNDEEESNYTSTISQSDSTEFMRIDASKREKNKHLTQVMGELDVSGSAGADDDLLDLMDAA